MFTRRTLLKSAVATAAVAAIPNKSPAYVPPFDLDEITIAELQRRMASGELTSRAIAEKYLARIAMIDRQGPTLNEVLELNPDALPIADALDAERKAKGARGPLHGIPILVKDNIDTHDRMMTTAGSLALVGPPPARDAHIAHRLRTAGAVILGKTNLSEWANFRSFTSTSGWSARGGVTKNPYALDRNTSGSSSGSAAAVAANLCAVAVGTETDGSIISPSSINSIVGIKPTLGLVSRAGIIPIAHSQDTAGPMARTVADAAILLTALAGADPDDVATIEASNRAEDYTKALQAGGLKGARIGVVRAKAFNLSSRLDPFLDDAIAVLKREGAIVSDPVEVKHLGEYDDAELDVLLYEFKADLNKYLASRPDIPVKSLADIIAFNEQHRESELRFFGQELFVNAEKKGPLTSKEYLDALGKCRELSRAKGIDATMNEQKLDALVSLSGGAAWMTDLVNGDKYTGFNTSLSAVSGTPHITLPAGYFFGLPIGLSFLGRAWSEPTLLRLAYGYEQATHARKAPRFLSSATL